MAQISTANLQMEIVLLHRMSGDLGHMEFCSSISQMKTMRPGMTFHVAHITQFVPTLGTNITFGLTMPFSLN